MSNENEIHIESEETPESQAYEKLIGKLEALKEELKQCKIERQEYLDGWQRMRADVANKKREESISFERMESAISEEVIADIIPIVDSFDMAMAGEGWGAVSENWRKGVEHIRTQCVSVLEKHGITSFGAVGEQFDPSIHEPVAEVEDTDKKPHTITRVIRFGYKTPTKLIRPAQVEVVK